MHTYLLARQGRSKEIDTVSILLQSVIISTGVRFRHLPPFQFPRSPPHPLFRRMRFTISPLPSLFAIRQSPTTMPGTTSPLKACCSYSDPCSTSKTPSTGRTNPEQQRRCRKSSLIWPAHIAPTLFRKRPRSVHVQRRGYYVSQRGLAIYI
jgi:hypothetical protein